MPSLLGADAADGGLVRESDRFERELLPEAQGLLRHVAAGDSSAFWELWEAHKKYLYTICLRQMGGVQADAEDALSRAMIKAWDRLPAHADKIDNLRAWLARLTHNLCLDMHRERRRLTRDVESIEDIVAADYEALSRPTGSPEEIMQRREECSCLRRLIGQLSPSLRWPLVMHYFHGADYSEIADGLDLSKENVRKRVQQARDILRERLTGGPCVEAGHVEAVGDACAEEGGADYSTTDYAHVARSCEIAPGTVLVRLAHVRVPPAREMSCEIILSHRPRQNAYIKTLAKYVSNYPRGWKKRWDLACLLYETGRWEEALGEYRQLLERQPRLIEAYLQMGDILRLLGRAAEAEAVYQCALSAARGEAARHHIGGWLEACRGRYAAAACEFQRASLLDPHNARHWHSLGLVYVQSGSYPKALQAFNEALRVKPNDLVALTYSYAPLRAAGRAHEAEQRLVRALELDAENVPALKRLSDHRSRVGARGGNEGKETRRLIRAALRAGADTAEVHESLALYHIFRGEWEKGTSTLRAFVEQHPQHAAGWLNYARGLFHTGHAGHAAEAVLRAEELRPDDFETKLAACAILAEAGERERLRRMVEAMLESHPERWVVWAAAGRALAERFEEFELACALSARGPRLQPHLAAPWFEHGRVLYLSGRAAEAIGALEEGWKCVSGEACEEPFVSAALWQGDSHRQLGEWGRARVWFEAAVEKAVAFTPHCPAVGYYLRGQALEALGDSVGAMQGYRAALLKHLPYPARREAQERLSRLQSRVRSAPARPREP